MEFVASSLLELITETSTNLPPDVRAAMSLAGEQETAGTQSSQALNIILGNIDMACDDEGPICQDTGMPTFYVHTPVGINQIRIRKAIQEAVAEATKRGKLRPNSVDSITGKNSGNNLGEETPVVHFEQWEQDEIEVKLILKGGGCENKNIQYSVPCDLDHLGRADRNLEGVRKCILHAVWQAQGQGCAPGALGVCIGSDRAHGYELAKQQLFRTLENIRGVTITGDQLAEDIYPSVVFFQDTYHLNIDKIFVSGISDISSAAPALRSQTGAEVEELVTASQLGVSTGGSVPRWRMAAVVGALIS